MGISTLLPMIYWPPYPLKRLSKQVNLCLYRESQQNQFLRKISDSWYTNFEILKIFLKFYQNFEFFYFISFNLMKYVSFEILWKFCNFFKLLIKKLKYFQFFYFNYCIFWNFIKMRGGFKIQWQKIDPGVKIPYGKLNPGSKYHR